MQKAANGKEITFDGKRARIGDLKNRMKSYALVWQIDCPVHQAQWSWDAVDRILAKDGKFTS